MFNDEYLEYWGTVFVACRLREQRMTFGEFLADPWGCLKATRLQSAPLSLACGYRPLLLRQAQLAQALWRRWELETDSGGSAIPEPDERLALMEEEESEP